MNRSKTAISSSGGRDSMNVSVIVPTYYCSYRLSCLFDSLLEQFAKPGEVLVVDDTPTTEIKDLCDKYAAVFGRTGVTLVYVRNCRERSISIARNLGAKLARGDIFLFIDNDVTLYPDYIKRVLVTFKKHPGATGVGGFQKQFIDYHFLRGVRYHSLQIFMELFLLWHNSRNSCSNFEIPIELSRTMYSQYLNGCNISLKKSVFNEFQFDENLKGYSSLEDWLFSASIYKRDPKSLLTTPEAMYIHTFSAEGRLTGKNLVDLKRRSRKYVQIQLWGSKGLLMFGWQNLGILIFKAMAKFRKWKFTLSEIDPLEKSAERSFL